METSPDAAALEETLDRGQQDVEAGRLRPIEEARTLIPGWIPKS